MNVSRLGTFNRYLQAQAALPETAPEPQRLAITISREAGAGGLTIAELLAVTASPRGCGPQTAT